MVSVITEVSDRSEPRGWLAFDASCHLCTRWARRSAALLASHGVRLVPLQADWVRRRLALPEAELLREMRLLLPDGRVYGGADAAVRLAREFWWAWPLYAAAHVPGVLPLLRRGYARIASRRHCTDGKCAITTPTWPGWTVLIALPAAALTLRSWLPAWAFMWLLAFTIFAGCKWQTWWSLRVTGVRPSRRRSATYLLAWPGMDAASFCDEARHPAKPVLREWAVAAGKALLGVALIWGVVPQLQSPLAKGWAGMLGLVLLLHFGGFHLLSLIWRSAGVDAQPIMNSPLRSTSLSEFWGRRWNLGFRELTHKLVFGPLSRRYGLGMATFAAFLVSGVIHDLVISWPAGSGFGLPTAYFLIQGGGVVLERSNAGRRMGLAHGWRAWLFMVVTTVAPLYALFHPPFVTRVIVPFLSVAGAS